MYLCCASSLYHPVLRAKPDLCRDQVMASCTGHIACPLSFNSGHTGLQRSLEYPSHLAHWDLSTLLSGMFFLRHPCA